ncbi:MAG TPA: hypothetical protein PK156_49980, partial [Polyangium sp.]|nr:hypothetical protein [Polyangium sp.]
MRDVGWLCGQETLAPAHDTVVDYVLLEVLRTGSNGVRKDVLDALVSPAFAYPLRIGDYSIVFGRIHAAASEFGPPLGRALQSWFEAFAPVLGKVLLTAEPAVVFPLLWDIEQCTPWIRRLIKDEWQRIVAPWLETYGRDENAGAGLFALLLRKEIQGERALQLIKTADEWLRIYGTKKDAVPVLMALMEHGDVPRPILERAANIAWQWYELHEKDADAPRALAAILENTELPLSIISKAVEALLKSCAAGPPVTQWALPLAFVCMREDLDARVRAEGQQAAWRWLRVHRNEGEAGFVLNALCIEPDAESDGEESAIEIALEWLDSHSLDLAAGLLLNTLSKRIERVEERAWVWFEHNKHQFWVSNILPLLIEAEHSSSD